MYQEALVGSSDHIFAHHILVILFVVRRLGKNMAGKNMHSISTDRWF